MTAQERSRHGSTYPGAGDLIAAVAEWLPDFDRPDAYNALFDRFGEARVVLLGAATHGTSEFLAARALITKGLIERHGFSLVALEADWPDGASFDCYVGSRSPPYPAEPAFRRFPTWRWRNLEFEAFVEWLRMTNADRPVGRRVRICGLDLYARRRCARTILSLLERTHPLAVAEARSRWACDEVRAAASVLPLLAGSEMPPDARASIRVVTNALAMEQALECSTAEGWNVRARHMFETLCTALEAAGPSAKVVVWAHNAIAGDASATEAGWREGRASLGQLCRKRFGKETILVGFGTDHGTVGCAEDWDAPMVVRALDPARAGSYELLARESRMGRFVLDFRPVEHSMLRTALSELRLERSVGVVCDPMPADIGQYSMSCLPNEYDAYVWYRRTKALTPIRSGQVRDQGDTYPFRI
jgi:erythromycin esterase-like protein